MSSYGPASKNIAAGDGTEPKLPAGLDLLTMLGLERGKARSSPTLRAPLILW